MKESWVKADAVLFLAWGETLIGVAHDGSNGHWFQIQDSSPKVVSGEMTPFDEAFQMYDSFYLATPEQVANL